MYYTDNTNCCCSTATAYYRNCTIFMESVTTIVQAATELFTAIVDALPQVISTIVAALPQLYYFDY